MFPIFLEPGRCVLAEAYLLESGSCYPNDMYFMSVGGVSVKMSNQPTVTNVGHTQFEYHLEDRTQNPPRTAFFDMSNVDCHGHQTNYGACPFVDYGIEMKSGRCGTRGCQAGNSNFGDFYQRAHDDWATSLCDLSDGHGTEIFMCTANMTKLKQNTRQYQCANRTGFASLGAAKPALTGIFATAVLSGTRIQSTMSTVLSSTRTRNDATPTKPVEPLQDQFDNAERGMLSGIVAGVIGFIIVVVGGMF
jgi:hypothetical protein